MKIDGLDLEDYGLACRFHAPTQLYIICDDISREDYSPPFNSEAEAQVWVTKYIEENYPVPPA